MKEHFQEEVKQRIKDDVIDEETDSHKENTVHK